MKTLRGVYHGPASQDRAEQTRFRSGAAATLTLLATAIFALAGDSLGVLALLPAAGLAIHQTAKGLRRSPARAIADRLVTNLLRELSDDYCLIENALPGRRNRLGHVLVGPCGVLVIETRRTAGRVLCYGERWYVNGWRRRGFGRRLRRAASVIDRDLRRWCPDEADLFRRAEPLVVFTHPRCRLNVYRPRMSVTRYSDLLRMIWTLERELDLPPEAVRRLAVALARGPAEVAPPEAALRHAVGW